MCKIYWELQKSWKNAWSATLICIWVTSLQLPASCSWVTWLTCCLKLRAATCCLYQEQVKVSERLQTWKTWAHVYRTCQMSVEARQTTSTFLSLFFWPELFLKKYYLLIFGGIFKNNSWYLAGSMLHYYWINSCLLTHKANSELNWIIGFMGETHRWLQVFLFWKRVKFLRRCFWRKWSHV